MILDLFIYIIQFYINQNTFLPGFIIRKEWVVNPLRLCFCCLVISVKPLANVVGDYTCSDRNYKVANKFHVLTSFALVSLGNKKIIS